MPTPQVSGWFGAGDHQWGPQVREHGVEARRGPVRRQQAVGGSGLQHGQQRDDQVGAARQQDRHPVAGSHPGGDQARRPGIRGGVELRVRDRARALDDGGGAGSAPRLPGDGLVQPFRRSGVGRADRPSRVCVHAVSPRRYLRGDQATCVAMFNTNVAMTLPESGNLLESPGM